MRSFSHVHPPSSLSLSWWRRGEETVGCSASLGVLMSGRAGGSPGFHGVGRPRMTVRHQVVVTGAMSVDGSDVLLRNCTCMFVSTVRRVR